MSAGPEGGRGARRGAGAEGEHAGSARAEAESDDVFVEDGPPSDRDPAVAVSWPPPYGMAGRLLTLLLVIATLHLGRDVLVPLALALLLSAVLAPVISRLQRLGLPNVVSTLAVVSLAFTVLGSLGFVVARQALGLAEALPDYRANIEARIESLRTTGNGPIGEAAELVEDLQRKIEGEEAEDEPSAEEVLEEPAPWATLERRSEDLVDRLDELLKGDGRGVPVRVQPPKASPLEIAENVVGPLLAPLAIFGIVLVFVIFFLIYRQDLEDRLIHLAGKGHLDVTTHAIDEAGKRISRYLAAHIALNIAYAVPVGLGLWLIGLPGAVLWGVLAGILRFVPYVGPWTSALLPFTLSLAVFDGWGQPLAVAGLFIGLELFSNNVLEPWLYGSSSGLSTVAVLLAALFWGWLWGPIGIVLSVPLTAVLVVLGRHVPQMSAIAVLLGDSATLSPATRFYQRVLAGDVSEARELVRSYRSERDLSGLADEVLLPAISMEKREAQGGAISAAHSERFREFVDELLDELEEEHDADAPRESAGPGRAATEGPTLPCVHLEDESDELGARLAALALARAGHPARVLPARTLLRVGERFRPARILLCSGSPVPLRDVRRFCRSALQRLPESELRIAAWCLDPAGPSQAQLERSAPAGVTHDLRDTLAALGAVVDERPAAE